MYIQQLPSPTKSVNLDPPSANLSGSLTNSAGRYDTLSQKIHSIISKNPEQRRPKEIHLISQFIKDHSFFSQVASNIDFEFAKSVVLKLAEVAVIDEGKVLAEEGAKIDYVYIVVEGSLAKIQGKGHKVQKQTVYQRLVAMANKSVNELNKRSNQAKDGKGNRKVSISIPKARVLPQKSYKKYEKGIPEDAEIVEHCGIYDRSMGSVYLNTFVALSEIFVLKVPASEFLFCLNETSIQKINELGQEIKKFDCFRIPILQQEKQRFNSLVMALVMKKKKRGDCLYRQNDKSTSLFILQKGDVKLTKHTSLFEENPNDLYVNRMNLLEGDSSPQRQTKSLTKSEELSKEGVLPYADLRTLYNYQPKKKTLDIGLLSPFCIFGEEEYLGKKERETNAFCSSTEVIYYEIPFKKIQEIIGNKSMPQFLKQLKQSSKNKVLYRQNQYANTINFSNKQHLDCFYVEGEKEKQVSTKFRISKFNRMMEPKTSNSSRTAKGETPPFYTTFNFHKMTASDLNPEANQNRYADWMPVEDLLDAKPSIHELKVMNMTHTWKIMERKVNMEETKSRKISPRKHKINIEEPLIENSFFRRIDKERRRIEREERLLKQATSSSKGLRRHRK